MIIPAKRIGSGASTFTATHSAPPTAIPSHAARHRQEEALEEELPLDRPRRRAERLADADLARPVLDRDQHDVHHADAAERQRHEADHA